MRLSSHPKMSAQVLGLSLALFACDKKATDEPCTTDCSTESGAPVTSGGTASESSSKAITVGTGPSFSDITSSGYTVSWTAATDTADTALEYQLVVAGSKTLLATLKDAEAAPTADIAMPFTAGALSKTMTGLLPSTTMAYAVIVRDSLGNRALYPAVEVATLDPDAPTPGAAITFGLITDTSFSIYWGAATSTISAAANLQYKVVLGSSTSAVSTVAAADAVTGANLVMDWTANRTGATYIPSGLPLGALTYGVAVLVKDEKGTKAIYTPQAVTTLPHRLIFVTSSGYSPDTLASLSLDDSNCNAQKPAGRGTFKAMIGRSNARVACVHPDCEVGNVAQPDGLNWVMLPNTIYENAAGAIIWKTNAGAVVSRADYTPGVIKSPRGRAWTGLNADWTIGANCNEWSSTSSTDHGSYGASDINFSLAWSMDNNQRCDGFPFGTASSVGGLYCVEQ